MKMRLNAIKFLILQCLKLDIDMKNVCRLKDGRKNINAHIPFSKQQLNEIFCTAKTYSPKIHAMVRLLYDMAARIQDVVGLTFKDILGVQPNNNGNRMITLTDKKTCSRVVKVRPKAFEAVKEYFDSLFP